MKTTYYVKQPGQPHAIGYVDFLRENYRKPGAELWRITEEDEGEAAIRRMKFLGLELTMHGAFWSQQQGESITQWTDRMSPPPARTECRVDWDTLEEVKEPEVWQLNSGFWLAGMSQVELKRLFSDGHYASFFFIVTNDGTAAIGPTRETALRNLREMQEARKAKA